MSKVLKTKDCPDCGTPMKTIDLPDGRGIRVCDFCFRRELYDQTFPIHAKEFK